MRTAGSLLATASQGNPPQRPGDESKLQDHFLSEPEPPMRVKNAAKPRTGMKPTENFENGCTLGTGNLLEVVRTGEALDFGESGWILFSRTIRDHPYEPIKATKATCGVQPI
jgi:hypothetical protein